MTKVNPKWPDGAWDTEPDHDEWRHLGLPCMIHRGPAGALCGYVAVPEGHPWYEANYDDCKCGDEYLDVHGGLTYANHCQGELCHVPKPGEPDNVWWVGFDCNHSGDVAPNSLMYDREHGWSSGPMASYRSVHYVRRQVESLARQARTAQGWESQKNAPTPPPSEG